MNHAILPDMLTDPRDAAAYWFARERSGAMSPEERSQLATWLQARPEHVLEYRRAQGIWNATALVPAERLRQLANPKATSPRFSPTRRWALAAGLACTAALATGLAWHHWPATALYELELNTLQGEHRQVALPDGSRIDVNTDTQLLVRFEADRRLVMLTTGEATFAVQPDTARPFDVVTGDTRVRVTGTRFNVRHDTDVTQVAVDSGAVEVSQGPWWQRQTARLHAGQLSRTLADGRLVVEEADLDSLLAWQQGRLIFRDTPLAVALAEWNRYVSPAMQLHDPALGALRIAGAFSTDDPQGFLALLPAIAPVRVLERQDGTPVITKR